MSQNCNEEEGEIESTNSVNADRFLLFSQNILMKKMASLKSYFNSKKLFKDVK